MTSTTAAAPPKGPPAAVPFERAEAVILGALDSWVRDLYYMPFWRRVGTDPDATNLLYGWAVENFHYTASVRRHITPVIQCNTGVVHGLSHRLLVHLSEEWDHPHLFLEAARRIAKASGSDEDPSRSRPLAATRSLATFLRQAGRVHPIVYKSCAATLERTAVRIEETRVFYHHVAKVLNLPTAAVAPFIAHAETDESYEHLNSLREFRDDIDVVETAVVDAALTHAREFVHLYRSWQAAISEHYGRYPAGHGSLPS
jgi:hypothetical protein